MATFWRSFPRQGRAFRCMEKVKAHTQEVMEWDALLQDAYLNQKADVFANLGRELQAVPRQARDEYGVQLREASFTIKGALKVLATLPSPAQQEWPARRLTSKADPVHPRHAGPAHHWIRYDGHWRCRHCLRSKRLLQSSLDLQPCGDLAASVQALASSAHAHNLQCDVVWKRDWHYRE